MAPAPRILQVDLPEERPSGAPAGGFQQISSSADAFGGATSRALGQFGEGLEKVGKAGLEIATDINKQKNILENVESESKYGNDASTLDAEFRALRGRAAMDALPEYQKKLESLRTDALNQTPSVDGKTRLAPALVRIQDQYQRYWSRHAASEVKTYSATVAKDALASTSAQGSTAIIEGDDANAERLLRRQDMEVYNLYGEQGYEQKDIANEATKRRGITLRTAIETIAAGGDIGRAEAVFEQYRDRMDEPSKLAIIQKLASGRALIEGRALADEAAGYQPGTSPSVDKVQAYEHVLTRAGDNWRLQDAAIHRLNQVYGIYNSDRIARNSAFDTKLKDTAAESLVTGAVREPLTEPEFVARYGAEAGPVQFAEYRKDLEHGATVSALAGMTPGEQQEAIASASPLAGQPEYARQLSRADAMQKALAAISREKANDPAAFAIQRLPAVQAAWGEFAATMNDPQATPEARRAMAAAFAYSTLSEQARVGVPDEQRAIVPKGYVERFKAQFARPVDAGGGLNVAQAVEREAALWGDNWPRVYGQLGKGGGLAPVVRVIGSGLPPYPARILAEIAPLTLPDILKDQDEARATQIKGDVLTAFKPFARSLAGNEGGLNVFNDFRLQGEKLAAYYVVQGKTSSEAAEQAFSDLVGHKYVFGPTYRIPKAQPEPVEQIQVGAEFARRKMADFNIAPRRDDIGGLSPDYLRSETARIYGRDGVWVTAPDESGLMLTYADQAVRRADGQPLILPWRRLAELGREAAAKRERARDLIFRPGN